METSWVSDSGNIDPQIRMLASKNIFSFLLMIANRVSARNILRDDSWDIDGFPGRIK